MITKGCVTKEDVVARVNELDARIAAYRGYTGDLDPNERKIYVKLLMEWYTWTRVLTAIDEGVDPTVAVLTR